MNIFERRESEVRSYRRLTVASGDLDQAPEILDASGGSALAGSVVAR